MQSILTYLICTAFFFAIDILWLGVIAKNFYRKNLGFVLSPDVNWPAAVVFYLLYIAGILYFAVNPALKQLSWQTALVQGALLGGLCYATYDLTNMATIKNWPLIVVLVDIIWGMALTGTCAVLTYLAAVRWFS